MNIEFHIGNLAEAFSAADINLIYGRFAAAAERANEVLKVKYKLHAYFNAGDTKAPPWFGVSGNAGHFDGIGITLDPNQFYLRNNLYDGINRFGSVVTHELHHCARQSQGAPGYGTTCGETVISEGLAEQFPLEIGYSEFPDDHLARGNDLLAMSENLKSVFDIPHPRGKPILDAKGNEVEQYSVGNALIRGWKNYSGRTAGESYAVPAREILQPWLEGKYDICPDRRPPWTPPIKFLRRAVPAS